MNYSQLCPINIVALIGWILVSSCQKESVDVDIWHADELKFGDPVMSQPQLNVLGNVAEVSEETVLMYSLNDAVYKQLAIGPQIPGDIKRVYGLGDVNIEIFKDDPNLKVGPNTITFFRFDGKKTRSQEFLFEYAISEGLKLPYSIDWSSVEKTQDAVQIVDGQWFLDDIEGFGRGVRTAQLGYDRAIAVGDPTWGDYEVTTSFYIHEWAPKFNRTSNGALVAMVMHWNGHCDRPSKMANWSPKVGYRCNSGFGGIKISNKELETNMVIDVLEKEIRLDNNFGANPLGGFKMKMRVVGREHSLKVWKIDSPEPTEWELSRETVIRQFQKGSILLVAHHADITFGDIVVKAISK